MRRRRSQFKMWDMSGNVILPHWKQNIWNPKCLTLTVSTVAFSLRHLHSQAFTTAIALLFSFDSHWNYRKPIYVCKLLFSFSIVERLWLFVCVSHERLTTDGSLAHNQCSPFLPKGFGWASARPGTWFCTMRFLKWLKKCNLKPWKARKAFEEP